MLKQSVFSIFFMGYFNISHCMITQFTYEPNHHHLSYDQMSKREHIGEWIDASHYKKQNPIPDIAIFRPITIEEQRMRCFDYAMAHILGKYNRLTIYIDENGNQSTTINIEKYFEQTEYPQYKDAVIYTINKHDHRIAHVATVLDENTFISKPGKINIITIHRLFALPIGYGTVASFWTLKKEFKEDRKKLIKNIRHDVRAFNHQRHKK